MLPVPPVWLFGAAGAIVTGAVIGVLLKKHTPSRTTEDRFLKNLLGFGKK